MMAGKEGAAKHSHSLRNPSHCHTVCLQVPLSLSHLFSVSFCRSISLSPSSQKVVLCRWFTHLHFFHSSRCKPNQMVSWDCLKHHSYKLPTVGNYQHRLLFLRKKKKIMFLHMPKPSRGHPSISKAWILQQKGSAMPAVSFIVNCALWLNKEVPVGEGKLLYKLFRSVYLHVEL